MSIAMLSLSVLCVGMVAGCGAGKGPVETDNQAPISSLLSFINSASDKFIAQVATVPEIEQSPHQLVLELGTIQCGPTMTRSDYELVQDGVRGRLLDSRIITDRFRIVQNIRRSRADQKLVEIGPSADTDITQEGPGTAAPAPEKYNPSDIYTLNGTFQRVGRSKHALYQFQMTLVKWDTRQIVLSKTYQQVVKRD